MQLCAPIILGITGDLPHFVSEVDRTICIGHVHIKLNLNCPVIFCLTFSELEQALKVTQGH